MSTTLLSVPRLTFGAPKRFILSVFFGVLLLLLLALWQLHHSQWVGFDVEPTKSGVRIVHIYEEVPSDLGLHIGDVLVSASANQLPSVKVDSQLLIKEPHELSTYEAMNDIVDRHGQLNQMFNTGLVVFELSDGRQVRVPLMNDRPIRSIPVDFWVQQLFGILILMVGVSVWSFRKTDVSASFFVLTGLGLYTAAWCSSIIAVRGLGISADYFQLLLILKDAGNFMFAVNSILLLYQFPRGKHMFLFTSVLYGLLSCAIFNEFFQWVEPPVHAYQVYYHALLIVGVSVAVLQWKRTSGMPLERSVLRWVLLSIFGSLALLFSLYLVPIILLGYPLVSYNVGDAIMVLMYVGMAVGVARYRMFDLEEWWVTACLWLLGGLLVLVIDVFLMFLVKMNSGFSTGVAVAIAGWLYFPVRQKMLIYFLKSPVNSNSLMSDLLEKLYVAHDYAEVTQHWKYCLDQLFEPLHVSEVRGHLDQVIIQQDGICLSVPSLRSEKYIELSCAGQGNLLFSQADQRMVQAMWFVARRVLQQRDAYEQGVKEERKRIMRDLHDDVAARLLTLIHQANNERDEQRARLTLKALRDVIYSLDDDSVPPLLELLLAWEFDMRERVEAASITFDWVQYDIDPDYIMLPRQRINLVRILHEAISNAIVHAQPQSIGVEISIEDDVLLVRISDNGQSSPVDSWVAGKGLNHIRTRAKEIGGGAMWIKPACVQGYNGGCTLEVRMPLGES